MSSSLKTMLTWENYFVYLTYMDSTTHCDWLFFSAIWNGFIINCDLLQSLNLLQKEKTKYFPIIFLSGKAFSKTCTYLWKHFNKYIFMKKKTQQSYPVISCVVAGTSLYNPVKTVLRSILEHFWSFNLCCYSCFVVKKIQFLIYIHGKFIFICSDVETAL